MWEVQLSSDFNREDYLKRMEKIIQQNTDTFCKFKQETIIDWDGNKRELNYAEEINKIKSKINNWK